MRFKKYIRSFAFLLLLPAFLWACEDQTKVCDQTLRSDFRMNFRHDHKPIPLVTDSALPKCTILALNKDTIYNKTLSVSSATLALDPLHDTTQFYIRADSTSNADTLTLYYTRSPHFVSAGCGFTTFFTLDTVFSTKHSILKIDLLKKQITTDDDTHVTLYF